MEKQPNKITPGGYIWTLSIIHLGLIVGPLIFGIISYRETHNAHIVLSETDDLFLAIVPVFVFGSILLGNFIFRQTVKNIPKTSDLRQRLTQFQTASIIRYALIEAATIFGIVAFLMTQNLLFLLLSGIVALYFLVLRPTKEKIVRTLNLTEGDRDRFNRLNQPL